MAEDGMARITIDGREVSTREGRLLIDVAEEMDVFIPRFCYHPGMESVAVCRMCLVEIEGGKRPLEPACVTRIADGMAVSTRSDSALKAQESVLELLLINHPLDCPICDRGGECPLQDQALRFGPGMTRYREEKRHFPKPIPISKLVTLDRERCVLCWRCVRFAEEVAGDPFIDLMDRGSLTQINIAEEKPFDSYFSGNTIQICPVGALTSTSYRFLSRPWDLKQTQTICSFCSVGCPITLEERGGRILRAQALPNENVNSFWNCDKGRFGHSYISHPDRLRTPLIKREGESGPEFVESSWSEALDVAAHGLRKAIETGGPQSVGFIGGSHATNEDLYAACKFFRDVVGTGNLDFRTFDASFDYGDLGGGVAGSTAMIQDLDSAKAILWLGPDPKEELPVLYLRLRKAALGGAKLIVCHPRRISLCSFGMHLTAMPDRIPSVIRALGGADDAPDVAGLAEARDALSVGSVVVCVGPQFPGMTAAPLTKAVADLMRLLREARLLLCVPNANSQGALDMGVSPAQNAGRVKAGDGMGTTEILRAVAEGKIKFLWSMGADLLTDIPDASLVEAALSRDVFLVVSELFPTETARSAHVVLPAASLGEKEGSFTNLERRIQKVNPAIAPPGVARADWLIFQDLANRFGAGFAWSSSADVAAEIAERVPTHGDYSWRRIAPPPLPLPKAGTRPGGGAWPLSWELRAVDATRSSGLVWEAPPVSYEPEEEVDRNERPWEAPEGFPLMLLASRAIYDNGQMVSRSPDLRAVTPPAMVELHPEEASARGLHPGEEVTVSSPRGSVKVILRVSEDTPAGAAHMLFDQPGAKANVLMDLSQPATYVEVRR